MRGHSQGVKRLSRSYPPYVFTHCRRQPNTKKNGFRKKTPGSRWVLSSERGKVGTGSSSFPPQVDATIGPFRTNQRGCSCSWPDYYAGVKGRKPVVRLEEPEPELLLQPVLALAERLQEQQPELLNHRSQIRSRLSSSRCRNTRHSIRRRSHIRTLPKPVLLHGERHDHSQPEHRSEQKQHMGCSSSGSCESGRRFRQQLPGELVRHCRSDRRRMRS